VRPPTIAWPAHGGTWPNAGWEAVETYVDRAAPFESRALCEGWHNALAAVEQGKVAGVVTPLLVMLGHLEEDRANLAAWQARTGALITTPWAVVDAAGAMVARRSATYVGRFGFGTFQVLFLPVLVTGTTLTTLYAGQFR